MIDVNDTDFDFFNKRVADALQTTNIILTGICNDACIRRDILDISNIKNKIIFVEFNLIGNIEGIIDDSMYYH